MKDKLRMAISNCKYPPLLKFRWNFKSGGYLQSLVLTHATTHSRDRCTQAKKGQYMFHYN